MMFTRQTAVTSTGATLRVARGETPHGSPSARRYPRARRLIVSSVTAPPAMAAGLPRPQGGNEGTPAVAGRSAARHTAPRRRDHSRGRTGDERAEVRDRRAGRLVR